MEKIKNNSADISFQALRPYQNECLTAVKSGLKKNNTALIQIPTGGGKTLIFSIFALSLIERGQNVLVLVHRGELLSQTVEKFKMIGGAQSDTGIIKSGSAEYNKLTVGMIQTVFKQINKLDVNKFDTVIIDEAHHSMASTWRAVIEKFKSAGKKILGVTATPFRTDKQELKELYDELVFKIDITDLMRLGYLASLKGLMVYVETDYSKLVAKKNKDTCESDFTPASIEAVLNNEKINGQIVDKWLEYGENRKTIFFTISVEHANALFNEFKKKNVSAVVITGKTPVKERNLIIEDFKSGKINVLINVDILTEGFDDPSVQCIALVRPTKSLSLYAQIIGRGLRISDGKTDCLVLDYTGRNRDMTIVGLGELFDLPEELKEHIDKEGLSIGSVETDEYEDTPLSEGETEGQQKKRQLKVLIGRDTRSFTFDSKEAFDYATKYADGHYVLTCGRNGIVLELKKENGSFSIYKNSRYESKKIKANIAESYSWLLFTTMWKYYKDEFAEEFAKRAKDEVITPKQRDILIKAKNSGLISEIPATRADASNMISHLAINNGNIIFAGYGINYAPDKDDFSNPRRYEYKGQKITIAYALLLAWGLKLHAPKWVTDIKGDIKTLDSEGLKKINLEGLKNQTDKEIIEKLKNGLLFNQQLNVDISVNDEVIGKFLNHFRKK
jgi:superfamily II DNA or RNA helicase